MARRPLAKRHIRNIQRSHGTYYVTLPTEVVHNLRWRERQKVEVREYGKDKIIIKDWKHAEKSAKRKTAKRKAK